MGAGASAMPVAMLGSIPEDQMEEMAGQIPPEAIDLMKKLVAAAEEHQKSSKSTESTESTESKPKESTGKPVEAIKKIGNSDEATEMKRAIFMWDEEATKTALKEILKDKEVPKANGAMLVMDQVQLDPEDAKKLAEALKWCAWDWFSDQPSAEKPFTPPEKALESCAYLWDEKQTDAWLEKIGVKKVGKKAKDLMDNEERANAFPDMDESDKVIEKLKELALPFMKDVVKASM